MNMLSIFLRRIEKTRKTKPTKAAGGPDPAGQAETATPADSESSDIPDAVSAGDGLPVLLKIIRDNAEFLEIMYGESLPVKNIMAAVNQAMAAVRLEKQTPDRSDKARSGLP
jgi:hypothetical protein